LTKCTADFTDGSTDTLTAHARAQGYTSVFSAVTGHGSKACHLGLMGSYKWNRAYWGFDYLAPPPFVQHFPGSNGKKWWCNPPPIKECSGQQLPHAHDMAFFRQVWEKGDPSFGYLHTGIGHSPNKLEDVLLLDSDLKKFIAEMLDRKDTAIVLMGDHGRPYNSLASKLPLLSILMPRTNHSCAHFLTMLRRNERRLAAGYDVYKTILSIMYSGQLPKRVLDHPHGTSLTLAELSPSRTCQQANIPEYRCTCKMYTHRSLAFVEEYTHQVESYMSSKGHNLVPQRCPYLKTVQIQNVMTAPTWANSSEMWLHFDMHTTSNLTFRVEGTMAVSMKGPFNLESVKQLTSYNRFEYCVTTHANKASAEFCACQ
jgi:hypothetical protein